MVTDWLPIEEANISQPSRTGQQLVFYALADPTRRAILTSLRSGAQSVNEIAKPFAMSRPAVSKHLRILLESELVSEERDGRQNIYSLNSKPLQHVDDWLEEYRKLWTVNLSNLKAFIEDNHES